MQKISRIYIGNCGYSGAWYDGLTFDLTDPETDLPSDVILNLENGGGKTTLLSLIFSCFETSQDRFLKHIQTNNNHFTQYFSQDGSPGIILVEWLMPCKTPIGDPYRLIVGQSVSLKPGADSVDTDRIFFSFEAKPGLDFLDIPAPKLGATVAGSQTEFLRWLYEKQKDFSGDVYITRKQADWQSHLRQERLIDLDMLQMQVNFSMKEGAFDDGFLTFKTELEFLRKFFLLTLEPQHSAQVRDAVALACDKLRSKPTIQRRLMELNRLQSSMALFSGASQDYRQAIEAQAEVLVEGARLATALNQRAGEEAAEQEDQLQLEREQRSAAEAARTQAAHWQGQVLTLTALAHEQAVQAAQSEKTKADQAVSQAKTQVRHVKAARLRAEVLAAKDRVVQQEQLHEEVLRGLVPYRKNLDRAGALLRGYLSREERALRDRVAQLEGAHIAHKGEVATLDAGLLRLDQDRNAAIQEQASLQAWERQGNLVRQGFLSLELLTRADEPIDETVARWATQADQLRLEHTLRQEDAKRQTETAQLAQDKTVAESGCVARLDSQHKATHDFLTQGRAERDRLSRLPAILSAIEADVADPDSPDLPRRLTEVIEASEREITNCALKLEPLNKELLAIEGRGLPSSNPDAERVVQYLRAAGIRSAQAFNEYIADAIADEGQALALVLSDPGRFAGVCVAASELAQVRAMDLSSIGVEHPVMVSATALEATRQDQNFVVAVPRHYAVFSRTAADKRLKYLEASKTALQEKQAAYRDRRQAAQSALSTLEQYRARFGAIRLEEAAQALEQLVHERDEALRRQAEARAQAQEARDAAEACRGQAQDLDKQVDQLAGHLKALRDFKREHEDRRESQATKQQTLAASLAEMEAKIQAARQRKAGLTEQTLAEGDEKAQAQAKADQLAEERGKLKYYDTTINAAAELQKSPCDLATLRDAYQDAFTAHQTQETDRLGVVHAQLESLRKEAQKKQEEFTRDYPEVMLSDLRPYEGLDHAALLRELEDSVSAAQEAQVRAAAALTAAQTLSARWHTEHPYYPAATEELQSLSAVELATQCAQAQDQAAQARESARAADEAASLAQERARKLGEQAKDDRTWAKLTMQTLDLPEASDPVLLALDLARRTGADPVSTDSLFVLELDSKAQVQRLIARFKDRAKALQTHESHAYETFERLRRVARSEELKAVDPELCHRLQNNEFKAACADADRLLDGLQERIEVTQDNLDKMQEDLNDCAVEVVNLAREAVKLLTSATTKKVPERAPYVGGKAVLKIRANFSALTQDERRRIILTYLEQLIATTVIPAKGSDLVAEVVLRFCGGRALGLQLLKMVPDEAHQYVALEQISNSGGEGVVMAMFLYGVIVQLRADGQANIHRATGGPLLLDNPFSKATHAGMWKAQRLLAAAMNIQLIFTTAIQDYNALGEFSNFKRIRKAGRNAKTGRTHLEVATYKLNELKQEVA